jgi:hypothetical protein
MVLFSLALTFGQSYQGPATGSVSSGVQVSTDSFNSMPTGSETGESPRTRQIMEYISEPIKYKGDQPVFDNYTYVEDKNTTMQRGEGIGPSFEIVSFPSLGQSGSVPGDPHMAVGPNHIVTTANSRFAIYDREGNSLKVINADTWCSAVVGNPGAFDPQIIYDHYENRWFMLWDSYNPGTLTAWHIISYSDDSDPNGIWYMYALDATVNGTTEANDWGDYPQLGYDDQGIYISSRQFTFSGSFNYSKIRILNKSELYAANTGPLSWTDLWNIRLLNGQNQDDIHPTISYDPGNNTAYFFWATDGWNGPASFYVLYKITNPISSPVLTGVNLPVPTYYAAPHGRQLGTTELIDAGAYGSGMRNAPIIRNDKLYGVHHIRNTQFALNSSIKYFVVDVNTNAVTEQVEFGAEGYYYLYPAIAVDMDHNLAITYSRTAATEYVGAFYSTKLSTDPPGLSESKVMQEGSGSITFNRWGDYLSAALDPFNQYNIVLYSEYASGNQWGTWVTDIRMKPYSGIYGIVDNDDIDLGDVELGFSSDVFEVNVTNYGDADLVITAIPSTVGDFTLVTSPPLPATLGFFDSLKLDFTYTPTSLGSTQEFFSITNNDPGISGITVSGNGYHIIPAYSEIFYGSSGPINNGDILFINRTTGQGTTIGNSLYNEVTSLTVHPTTNELYGLISGGAGTAEIVRINAEGGDAYTLFTLDLFPLTGIAFNSTGTLYVSVRTGEIYTVDLTNGNYSLVTTSTVKINAIAFDPLTDELWAAYWVPIGATKDQVYKIDLTTGNATLIGETGFDVLTNDLAFDDNGDLYGVIGASNENGQLITINTNDGTGTVVGDVGIQNIVGLGYSINGDPVSVETEDDSNIPADYSLAQNYPNPFNPSTSIEFSVPVNSDVTIKIYNLLGEVVTTLVNEEINTGNHSVVWNGNDNVGNQVASGIYFYEMKANGNDGRSYSQIMKMVLLK